MSVTLPSVLWHCWLGVMKSIRPVNKLSDEVLAWLSVWTEVQMICIWSSWCRCHPIISCSNKIQNSLTFLVPAYPGWIEQEAIKWASVCLIMSANHLQDDQVLHKGSHSFYLPPTRLVHKWNEPYLPLLPSHSVTTLWLVLISHPTEGRRLSWPG